MAVAQSNSASVNARREIPRAFGLGGGRNVGIDSPSFCQCPVSAVDVLVLDEHFRAAVAAPRRNRPSRRDGRAIKPRSQVSGTDVVDVDSESPFVKITVHDSE